MKCPSCGVENMANSFQCIKCGAKMSGAPAPAVAPSVGTASSPVQADAGRFSLDAQTASRAQPARPSGPATGAGVAAAFADAGGLIVMAAVNLILGGVIGVIFVGFDAYIRSLVLKNAHLFTG